MKLLAIKNEILERLTSELVAVGTQKHDDIAFEVIEKMYTSHKEIIRVRKALIKKYKI